MRKTTKGAIAVGAGVALLLGGAGTLAAWSTSTTLTSQTVTAGDLNLTTAAGTWYWGNTGCTAADTTKTIAAIASARIVPGDCLFYQTTATVTAVGDNLKAEAEIQGTVTPTGGLASYLTVSTTLVPTTLPTGVTQTSSTLLSIDASAATVPTHNISFTVPATVKVVFNSATANRDGATTSGTIAGVALTLKQKAPAVAP